MSMYRKWMYIDDHMPIYPYEEAAKIGNNLLHTVNEHLDVPYKLKEALSQDSPCWEVPQDRLWDGEIDAKVYKVGVYFVRFGTRCYDADGYEYDKPQWLNPITGERLESFRQYLAHDRYIKDAQGVLLRVDVSVRSILSLRDSGYRHLYGLPMDNWHVNVESIITTESESHGKKTDEMLCLRENYCNSSFSSANCFICLPDGTIMRRQIYHDYSRQSETTKWNVKIDPRIIQGRKKALHIAFDMRHMRHIYTIPPTCDKGCDEYYTLRNEAVFVLSVLNREHKTSYSCMMSSYDKQELQELIQNIDTGNIAEVIRFCERHCPFHIWPIPEVTATQNAKT